MKHSIWELGNNKCPNIIDLGHFLLRRPLKTFPYRILLDNILTHLLKKHLKMFIIGGEQPVKTLQILHFRIIRVLPHLNFSMRFCQF